MDIEAENTAIFEGKLDELKGVLFGWYHENLNAQDIGDKPLQQEYESLIDEVGEMECACDKCSLNLVDRYLWKLQSVGRLKEGDFEKMKFSLKIFIYSLSHLTELLKVCSCCGVNHKLEDLVEGYYWMGVLMGSSRERDDYGLHTILKKANDSRHAFNRQLADKIKTWYLENRNQFKNKDDAAQEGELIFHRSFSTIRKHLRRL